MKKIIIGISGASGLIYGIRMLKTLSKIGIETHLVMTHAAIRNLKIETKFTKEEIGFQWIGRGSKIYSN